ncbi:hypothetical protein BaRGS_00014551 [Batillaria attramentaria]|uniref:Uncharacterized protein n=1 Tax=Batillaria attramentaria TaxID=370345 RepID=A0ABD0L4B4_9CAEN
MPRSSPPQEAMSVTPQSKITITVTRAWSHCYAVILTTYATWIPTTGCCLSSFTVTAEYDICSYTITVTTCVPTARCQTAAARSPSPSPEYTVKSLTTRSPPPSQDMKQSRSPPSPPEKSLATLSLPSQDIQQSQSLSQGTKPVVTKSPPLSPGRSLATNSTTTTTGYRNCNSKVTDTITSKSRISSLTIPTSGFPTSGARLGDVHT